MIRPLTFASTIAFLTLAACNPAVKSTIPVIEVPAPVVQSEMTCPISGEPVTDLDEAAYFGSYPVYCKGRDNARQFAALDTRQRARLGAEQVLAQKGITNETCPLTGEKLDANAAAVVYQGQAIGFASVSDANQFRALKPEKQAKLIEQWKAQEPGSQN